LKKQVDKMYTAVQRERSSYFKICRIDVFRANLKKQACNMHMVPQRDLLLVVLATCCARFDNNYRCTGQMNSDVLHHFHKVLATSSGRASCGPVTELRPYTGTVH
jgi:uncharacterized CHY-type Zn-finger protein